jgi:formate C-acetyltransferase
MEKRAATQEVSSKIREMDGMSIKAIGEKRTGRTEKLRALLMKTVPEISSERVRCYTASYRDTEWEPVIMKRAKALRRMLNCMSLYILDGELIVGNTSKYPRGVELFPEYEVVWIERELDGKPFHFHERPGDRYIIKEEVRSELKELFTYWHGKTHSEHVKSMFPDTVMKAWEMEAIDSYWLLQGGDGHITVNFKKLLEQGVSGIMEDAKVGLSQLDLSDPHVINKKLFLEAALISLEAIVEYANRYAEYAMELSREEGDEARRDELKQIADMCRVVPFGPARSFREALQSIWFIQAVIQIETNGHSISLGRLDQTLYPYFRRDIDEGNLTLEEAAELLQCFWLKLFTVNKIRDWDSTRFFLGYQVFENITIGGQLYGGRDAANELSFLMLGVHKGIKLAVPSLSFRYFDGTSEQFLQAAIDVVKTGVGPALYSDECIIPSLTNRGISYEDALNWSVVGCVEPIIEGKQSYRPNGAAFINILKILELTLHGGKDPFTGHNLLPAENDLTTFSSFEDLKDSWEKQAKYYIEQQILMDNIIDNSMEMMSPNPFVSCFVDDCIKRGKTVKQGGAIYDYCGPLLVGIANVGDSLAAIKKLVFEEKKLTGIQILHALDTDFKDETTSPSGEEIRQMLLTAPKYGNDDDYADSLTAEALDLFCQELPKYTTTRHGRGPKGCLWHASCSTVSANIPFGLFVGATPDGRKAKEPTADTTSPTQGMDKQGPLSTMKSVGKIPNVLCSGGNLFNMKFSPLLLKEEAGRYKFSSLLRTFLGDLKGMHVQFNIVDGDTLREAKREPEKHPDLMVRVAGYSALYTALDPKLQDDIINRTEQLSM